MSRYDDIICWENEALYEPPYTKQLSDEQLKEFTEAPLSLSITSNSVQTERTIRDVASVSTESTSEEKRDGMIRSILKERKQKKYLEKKSDFISKI